MENETILSKILESLESTSKAQHSLNAKFEEYSARTEKEFKRVHECLDGLPRLGISTNESLDEHSKRSPQEYIKTDIKETDKVIPEIRAKITQSASGTNNLLYSERVILTTYPDQFGIKPIPLKWAELDPNVRGPIVASRHPASIKIRNAIGAYGGSYCVYRALAVAMGALDPNHRPDFKNTEPTVQIGPHPQWGIPNKIVSLDPFGHMATITFENEIAKGRDIHPTIAITKAHMKLPEIENLVKSGRLKIDGNVVLNQSGELNVVKAAVEPVWYLPGVAARFGIEEGILRRALFEDTGGMYPELITRPDLKVFLPPIGGLTVYIFGNPKYVSDPSKRLTVRVHDECNGSDVFGSDICTCRPYLIFGMEECVKEAQRGGSGVIVYFRKEGRALGEVTKYLVYNARKRSTGVKDMRFQALMPDVLHWLGISKIDRMMSMSNMKYDAIVGSGIEIHERVPIPDEMIPPDSRVPTKEELSQVKGREWDDIQH
ncbi:2809_t:CDS:2 [Diversispora eburnea]|uniref:2809_t:CDS:1 n=1 Tax=Diversispora eburnea TaxID=1213867 RepID=A0A9N8YPF5_9GLOM|nr:2809_t:CDS:2 [Diversispora eburnea]